MKRNHIISLLMLAVLLAGSAVFAYAKYGPVQAKNIGCPCGCNGECGGSCGVEGCTCSSSDANAGASCSGGCGGSCGGSCGAAGCGCSAK